MAGSHTFNSKIWVAGSNASSASQSPGLNAGLRRAANKWASNLAMRSAAKVPTDSRNTRRTKSSCV
jgi:hypothetical protein